jgi:hypothetical protein
MDRDVARSMSAAGSDNVRASRDWRGGGSEMSRGRVTRAAQTGDRMGGWARKVGMPARLESLRAR